jgi:hypothetical protein
MDWNVPDQFINECLPAQAALLVLCSLNSMNELHDSYDGQAQFNLTMGCLKLFQELTDGAAFALSRNNHAGIQY